jgi:hypothetical protein
MKIRITQPVEHDGKPLAVGKVADVPADQAKALIAAGSAQDPSVPWIDPADEEARAKAAAQEQAELLDDAKSWRAIQSELAALRAKAAAFDALPEDVRKGAEKSKA